MVVFGFILLTTSNGGMYAEHLHLRAAVGSSKISSENPPRGFEGWKGAPLWNDVEEIPVLFTKGADNADFVVVGHSTDLGKDKFFLASLHKHGIHAALSGNGTSWHWFEDKLMGAKAALLQMTGNPVVMFADTTDVMFSCSEGEILDRFDATDARVLIGGESQLWPEIDTYFDMQDERDFIERNSAKMDPEIGLRRGATKTPDGIDPRPNKWANGGAWMGRRNDILDYFEELESYLVTNSANQGAGDGFKKACKPYKMSDRTYKERTVARGFLRRSDVPQQVPDGVRRGARLQGEARHGRQCHSRRRRHGLEGVQEGLGRQRVLGEDPKDALRVAFQQPREQEAHARRHQAVPLVLGVIRTDRIETEGGEPRRRRRNRRAKRAGRRRNSRGTVFPHSRTRTKRACTCVLENENNTL